MLLSIFLLMIAMYSWYIKMAILGIGLLSLVAFVLARRGKEPIVTFFVGVPVALVLLFVATIDVPDPPDPTKQLTSEMRESTGLACKRESPNLAETYLSNSVAFTTETVNARAIFELIITRQLEFVEVKVNEGRDGQKPNIVDGDSRGDAGWTVDQQPGSYAKISLSDQGNARCMVAPNGFNIKEALGGLTLPSGKCISVTESTTPSAQHTFRFKADPTSKYGLVGKYQLLETESNILLAEISALPGQTDIPGVRPSVSNGFHCQSAGAALLGRVFGSKFHAENVSPSERDKANLACNEQLEKLSDAVDVSDISAQRTERRPRPIYVNDLADLATQIRPQSINNLLLREKLAFVEVKVQQSDSGSSYIVQPNRARKLNGWELEKQPNTYAKISLANEKDKACVEDSVLHTTLKNSNQWLPAGKCIKITYSAKPTARHQLVYEPDPSSRNSLLGHYTIVDTKDNSVVAKLATADKPKQIIEWTGGYPSCNSHPHLALVSRLRLAPKNSTCPLPPCQ
jgi:hypothetical protein